MAHAAPRTTLLALATGLGCACAAAQTPPQIKPGLWEVRTERRIDGKDAAPPGDAVKNMKPEVRARVEAMMKQQGLAIGSNGANRICFTQEAIASGRWHDNASCQTDYGSRSASAWKWHSVCAQSSTVIDGEAKFAGPESYTVSTTSTRQFRGESKTSQMKITARWLGADCGELKPHDPKH